jgi:hypothetical protein
LGGIVLPLAVFQLTRRVLESASSTHLLTALRERGLNTATLPLIAAGVAAIYFYFVLYAATLMTETFFITALLWSLDRAIALADTPTVKNGLVLGVGLAAATLLRQSVLPGIADRCGCSAAWRANRLSGRSAPSPFPALCWSCHAPFTLRNYRVFGRCSCLTRMRATYSAQHPCMAHRFKPLKPRHYADCLGGRLSIRSDGLHRVHAGRAGRYVLLPLVNPVYFEFGLPESRKQRRPGRVFRHLLAVHGLWSVVDTETIRPGAI